MKLYFAGRILPERANLNIEMPGSIESRLVDGSVLRLRIKVLFNQILIEVEHDDDQLPIDLHTVRNILRNEVEVLASIAGFLAGYSFHTEITSVMSAELETSMVYGIDAPVLKNRNAQTDQGRAVNALAELSHGSDDARHIRRCLLDLSLAISQAEDSAFHCFRALEALRFTFQNGDGKEAESTAWRALASACGCAAAAHHRPGAAPVAGLGCARVCGRLRRVGGRRILRAGAGHLRQARAPHAPLIWWLLDLADRE